MTLDRVVVSHPSIEPLQSAATFIAHVISPYIHDPGYTRHQRSDAAVRSEAGPDVAGDNGETKGVQWR